MNAGKCNSQEALSDRWVCGKYYSYKEALSYGQDCRSSFKSDLWCIVSLGEEKDLLSVTKLLLSAWNKRLTRSML